MMIKLSFIGLNIPSSTDFMHTSLNAPRLTSGENRLLKSSAHRGGEVKTDAQPCRRE